MLTDVVFYCVILCCVMFVMKVVLCGIVWCVFGVESCCAVSCRLLVCSVVSVLTFSMFGLFSVMLCYVLCHTMPCFSYVGFCFIKIKLLSETL